MKYLKTFFIGFFTLASLFSAMFGIVWLIVHWGHVLIWLVVIGAIYLCGRDVECFFREEDYEENPQMDLFSE